ncbi:MAG: Hsp20/alpha crystallin family protein [Planctomycetota bacterium]
MLPTATNRRMFEGPFEMLRDFDRAFNRLASYGGDDANGHALTASYPVDVREEESRFVVEAELPGFTKDQVEISLEDGVLSLTAERPPAETPDGQHHVRERRYTKVARKFSLPQSVDPNAVEASLADGVLTLSIGKRDEVKARRIEVK